MARKRTSANLDQSPENREWLRKGKQPTEAESRALTDRLLAEPEDEPEEDTDPS
jgi:hypothetical protein